MKNEGCLLMGILTCEDVVHAVQNQAVVRGMVTLEEVLSGRVTVEFQGSAEKTRCLVKRKFSDTVTAPTPDEQAAIRQKGEGRP
jgi:malate synthase